MAYVPKEGAFAWLGCLEDVFVGYGGMHVYDCGGTRHGMLVH